MTTNPTVTLFEQLLMNSPSGGEQEVAKIIQEKLKEYDYAHIFDAAGNVLVQVPGKNPDASKIVFAAHMDEIAMVVSSNEPNGDLCVTRLGGLYPWKLGEGPVEILGDRKMIKGVLSMGSTHTLNASEQSISWETVRIITGLSSDQLEEIGVRPGTPVLPTKERRSPQIFGDSNDPLISAWTFDDRMGCVTLLRLLDFLKANSITPFHPTTFAFTTREETGGHGAKYLVRSLNPEVFISIDGCPIPPGSPLKIDGRPGIWSKDRLAQYDQDLLRALSDSALKAGTSLQPAVYDGAASDASLVSYALGVPKIACIGHVRENSHGYEVARVSVFDNLLNTMIDFTRSYQ